MEKRMLKRVAWLCFAGLCCAGLLLRGGERSAGSTTYCPFMFYGSFNGVYMYGAYQQGADCGNGMLPVLYAVGDTQEHELGDCPVCPDPIFSSGHPAPIALDQAPLVPQPDPRFSGVLR